MGESGRLERRGLPAVIVCAEEMFPDPSARSMADAAQRSLLRGRRGIFLIRTTKDNRTGDARLDAECVYAAKE